MNNNIMQEVKQKTNDVSEKLRQTLRQIRAGNASPNLLDQIVIDYYGELMPLNQLASINVLAGRTLIVKPFEKNLLKEIEKAILKSDIGIIPNNDGIVIRLPIPHLTEERRKDLVKKVKEELENSKIYLRNIRHNALKTLKNDKKSMGINEDDIYQIEQDIQKSINTHSKLLEKIALEKQNELLKIS